MVVAEIIAIEKVPSPRLISYDGSTVRNEKYSFIPTLGEAVHNIQKPLFSSAFPLVSSAPEPIHNMHKNMRIFFLIFRIECIIFFQLQFLRKLRKTYFKNSPPLWKSIFFSFQLYRVFSNFYACFSYINLINFRVIKRETSPNEAHIKFHNLKMKTYVNKRLPMINNSQKASWQWIEMVNVDRSVIIIMFAA